MSEIGKEKQIELLKLNCSKDLEEYKHHLKLFRINVRGVLDFALAAIRTLILANGAAVVALLTFLGNKNPEKLIDVAMLGNALRAFAFGIALGVVAALVAYLSQLKHTWSKGGEGGFDSAKAKWLRGAGIILGICSAVAFAFGAFFGAGAFS